MEILCYRHRAKGFPTMPTCAHGEKSTFKCNKLSMQDVRKIHQHYYQDASLEAKENFILQHVTVSSVERKRSPHGRYNACERQMSSNFVLPKQREGVIRNVNVC